MRKNTCTGGTKSADPYTLDNDGTLCTAGSGQYNSGGSYAQATCTSDGGDGDTSSKYACTGLCSDNGGDAPKQAIKYANVRACRVRVYPPGAPRDREIGAIPVLQEAADVAK